MALFYLSDDNTFPVIKEDDDDLIAMGGELASNRILEAYRRGIFPWFSSDEQPICWYSLDPRLILYPNKLHISKSMKKILKNSSYTVRLDYDFESLIRLCQSTRVGQPHSTWITNKMVTAYTKLHYEGYAHSCEVYNHHQKLVGGFYGLHVGSIFCGESMVSLEPNSSKYALIKFIDYFKDKGLSFIDCQQPTEHMISMGATVVSRVSFITLLKQHQNDCNWRGNWQKIFNDFLS